MTEVVTDEARPLQRSRRERWAAPLAALGGILHALAGLFVLSWYYFIAPRWKYEIDQAGFAISQNAMLLIQVSDLVVNYWYVIVLAGLVFLVIDYFLLEWLGREVGLSAAFLAMIVIAIVMLSHVVYTHFVFQQETANLRKAILDLGRSSG